MTDGGNFRSDAPWRHQFDNARDPYTARNALGITSTGGGAGAPIGAQYITAAADPTLTAERVLTNTATVTWDFTTPGQAKANAATGGGGNVSNSGTPTVGQYAKWVTATTIQGVAPATVLSDIGAQPAGSYQPLDADLTSLAAAAATNAIYYRSAANTWATVTIGTGLSFTGGTLANTVSGGGNVSNSGTPTSGQIARWTDATHIEGVTGIPGSATNDSAAAGYVGECMEQTRSYASPLGLSNGLTVNLTASPLALTAGDWDICANVNLQITGSSTISNLVMSLSTTSATFNNVAGFRAETCVPNTGTTLGCTLPPVRISLAGNQNYYLVINAAIVCTSCIAYGIIHARRVR